jgi:RNA polymerase sigma-54 factor
MLFQTQKTALKPLTTAHLAQTMTLLEYSNDELRQEIESALANNPALELSNERRCPTCNRRLIGNQRCPVCSSAHYVQDEKPIIFISPRTDFTPKGREYYQDEIDPEEWTASVEDLATFVLRQIAPELAPEDRKIAAHLLSALDEDGLLTITLGEVAKYNHVPLSRVKQVQELIQRADPIGVGSLSPSEALLIQIKTLEENSHYVPPKTADAIMEGMHLLCKRGFTELGKKINKSTKEVSKIVDFIGKNLNPYPARAYWGDSYGNQEPNQYYEEPDIIIGLLDDSPDAPLVVEIVSPYAGALRVNPLFQKAISDAPDEKSEQWESDFYQATLLVKCIQQRNNTMVRLMNHLVTIQRKYILDGNAHLVPITRSQIAKDLHLHESTISRAVSGKAVQLPNKRIIPLSNWFDRSLQIRTEIIQLVSEEKEPLNDTQLTEILIEKGYQVARRTVAKYRSLEGIPPSRLRIFKQSVSA